MSGIPAQTRKSFEQTLQKIVKLQPEHLSVYSLILEEGTLSVPGLHSSVTSASGVIKKISFNFSKSSSIQEGTPFYKRYAMKEKIMSEEADRNLYADTERILKWLTVNQYLID